MCLISACGTCERSSLQNSIRGNTMSSANFVWPTHFARASTFRNGFPTTFNDSFLFTSIFATNCPTNFSLSCVTYQYLKELEGQESLHDKLTSSDSSLQT